MAGLAATERTTSTPYDAGRYNNGVRSWTLDGDGTSAATFENLAHGDVASTKMVLAVEGHISVTGATQVKFISKPSGTGTEVAWLDFVARGVQAVPAFHCEPGHGLQIQSTTSVTVKGEVKLILATKGKVIPALG